MLPWDATSRSRFAQFAQTSDGLSKEPDMTPKELVSKWVRLFNEGDIGALINLYGPAKIS